MKNINTDKIKKASGNKFYHIEIDNDGMVSAFGNVTPGETKKIIKSLQARLDEPTYILEIPEENKCPYEGKRKILKEQRNNN